MSSAFFGLNIAQRALNAQNMAMLTLGHNIANANTEGYTRQRVNIVSSLPYAPPSSTSGWGIGQIGTGADADSIIRIKDSYLDRQIRLQTSVQGEWSVLKDGLEEIEAIYNEPSEDGFASVFNAFWESWQELSGDAESVSVRALVRERSANLATAFNTIATQLEAYQASVNEEIKVKVSDINSISTQIADLNEQIASVSALGQQPNDLLDKRDLLLDQLSEVVNFTTSGGPNNQLNVFIGGKALVRENNSYEITAFQETVPTSLDGNTKLVSVKWSADLSDVDVKEGRLMGLVETRDDTVVDYYTRLDNLAKDIISEVNAQHQAGFDLEGNTGVDFFKGYDAMGKTNARSMALSDAIDADSRAIAAASVDPNLPTGGVGDGSNALAIVLLRRSVSRMNPLSPLEGGTYDSYFNGTIAQLGAESQEAIRMDSNQQLLLGQLKQHQESVSGVSIDEEMSNMIKFQNAYNAAARFMTAYDEMLDRLISSTGIVGR